MSKRRFINGKPVIRCSELNWLIECPGAATLESIIGINRRDEDQAWDGQWAHHKAATTLIHQHGAMGPEGGLPLLALPPSYEPPDFLQWVVDFYLAAVLEDAGAERAIGVEEEMVHEFPRFWLSGHCDVFTVDADATELNFDDLKAGVNVVDAAENNWQVLGYATLFKLRWESLRRIRGRIIQPRLHEDVAPRITGVTIDARGCFADLDGAQVSEVTIDGLAAALETKINEALDNPLLLRTGIKQCRWCPAKLKCPALELEEEDMKQLLITEDTLTSLREKPDDETLGRICATAKLLDSRFDDAKELLKERLHAEPGKKIVLSDGTQLFLFDTLGRRQVTDVGQAWEKLSEVLDAELAYGCMSISLEPAEKAVAKQLKIPHKTTVKGKPCGKAVLEQVIGHLITRPAQKNLQIVSG
jgi:hypothetical protein